VDESAGTQWLSLIDPKGLRNLNLTHPKLSLFKEVKAIEDTLNSQAKPGEPRLFLNSFVLSSTKFADLVNVGGYTTKKELEDRHILFMEDGPAEYLRLLFEKILPE
jgi:hypothetical protein